MTRKLITLRGVECIREAEVLVYDRLVSDKLIALARPEAEMIYCGESGRRAFDHSAGDQRDTGEEGG